jgi:tagatose 1,6-diphosphate aldolase GatY/KbaY
MLYPTRELLLQAQQHAYAVGAFNVYNLEGVRAVVEAAESLQSPAMLQLHPNVLGYGKSPLVALCLEAARATTVPISVHLDHSSAADDIHMALEAGMTSVLADGSHLPYAENLAFTRQMTQFAHSKQAAVEAEIGKISGTEDGMTVSEKEAKMTDPDQAAEFVKETQVDALAVTIGNVHGKYRSEPRLDFARLEKIRNRVDVPLVLHGASGLPEEMIKRSIELGVCKFNVNTEVRLAYLDVLRTSLSDTSSDLLDLMKKGTTAMQAVIAKKLQLFGSEGKASLYQSQDAVKVAG